MLLAEAGHDTSFLQNTVVLFGAALLSAGLLRVLRAPTVIGFLFAGVCIRQFGLIQPGTVDALAELGLVLLLFIIGLELSPKPLLRLGTRLLVAALLQVGATAAVTIAVLAGAFGVPFGAAAVLGLAVALSSTAIVLRQMSDTGELESTAGTITTGILLLQDMIVLLVLLILPPLATGAEQGWGVTLVRVGGAILALSVITLAARYALPYILQQVMRVGGRELLTLFAVVVACAGAYLAGLAGWSWALGACVAGLLLADTDARYQLIAEITPFRDVFNALFFIALGMLLDPGILMAYPGWVALAIVVTLVAKAVLAAGAIRIAGWPLRLAAHVGLVLATVSEFGFVVAREAAKLGLVSEAALGVLTVYIVVTMAVGAALVPHAGRWSHLLVPARRSTKAGEGDAASEPGKPHHVVIVGYGMRGEHVARVLRATHIPCRVVEANPAGAARARRDGLTALSGDATRTELLHRAGIDTARALVIVINDRDAVRRIAAQARTLRPDLYILARSAYYTELDALHRLGVSEVVIDEFETSIEIFAHLLRELAIPENVVAQQIQMVRAGRYGMLRGRPVSESRTDLMRMLELTVTQTHFLEDNSPAIGQTLRAINLRAATGVTVIAIVRRGTPHTNPPADFTLETGDVLVLVGSHRQLDAARLALCPTCPPDQPPPSSSA